MPRNMSFSLTADQVHNQTKTVTRRLGWWNIEPDEIINACEKCQGLKKGEKVKVIGRIRVLNTTHVRLSSITAEDVAREGFPHLTPMQFISLFMTANKGCKPDTTVNRIEFEYMP
jgi:hypothetical protein